MRSTLRLFRALPVENKRKKKANSGLLEKTISKGFIFSPEVIYNYSEMELIHLAETIEKEIGLTPEQMNSSFHKSWKKIKEASIEQLYLEQIIHYLTTYGFEQLGIYDKDSVYIPSEKLEIPDIDVDNVYLIFIKGYNKNEFKEKLLNLLASGIALSKETIDDVIDVALWLELNERDVEGIKNKETKAILYDYLDLVPENPTEFLRYIIYKATEKTLLIKNKELVEGIKSGKNVGIIKLLTKYDKEHGLEKLAEIFLRFKPLFLAFKTNPQLNKIINRIRKLAVKHHKPMKPDYLNEITPKLRRGEELDIGLLESELNRVNIFRKIRLAYALKFRTKSHDSILYRVRNGKGYAKEFYFTDPERAELVLGIVTESIIESIKPKVNGKKIYIPDYIEYTLPATEKMFTGNFPSGSHISISNDMIFGVHWENIKHNRIDLDLSVISTENKKIGWDTNYKTEGGNILFSGDMTNAQGKRGATELFYVKKQAETALILFVNYYNFNKSIEVPFKILVMKEQAEKFGKNYMVNPNNVLATATSIINQKQKILGLVIITEERSKFYFAEAYLGRSITASTSEFVNHSRKYLFNFYRDTISLNNILKDAGADMVKENKECDVDLSPEKLEKDSILNLLFRY
jgi:hypothetical protein